MCSVNYKMIPLLVLTCLISFTVAHPYALPIQFGDEYDEQSRIIRAAAYPVELTQSDVYGNVQNVRAFEIEPLFGQDQVRSARRAQSQVEYVQPQVLLEDSLTPAQNPAIRNARSADNVETLLLESARFVSADQADLTRNARGSLNMVNFEGPQSVYGNRMARSVDENPKDIAKEEFLSDDVNQRYKAEELFKEWEKSSLCYLNSYKALVIDKLIQWTEEFAKWQTKNGKSYDIELNQKEFGELLEKEVVRFEREQGKPRPSTEFDPALLNC